MMVEITEQIRARNEYKFLRICPWHPLLDILSICSPYADCIIIKGLAYALQLENNFKIIRHIFLFKKK